MSENRSGNMLEGGQWPPFAFEEGLKTNWAPLTLLFIIRDRPFLAGFSSMLSRLCWQPGLMFTGAAFLVFSHYFTNWCDRRVLKVLLGAATPFTMMALYFYSRGAFGDLWSLTITLSRTTTRCLGPRLKGTSLTR